MEDPIPNTKSMSDSISARLMRFVITCLILAGTAAGVGYFEFQTNYLASRVGAYLVSTNHSRTSSGKIWDRMSSERQVQDALPDTDLVDVDQTSGLTSLVRNYRITVDRIPDAGLPGYLAIQSHRVRETGPLDVARIVQANRLQTLGGKVFEAARFDPTPYYADALEQAKTLSLQAGSHADSAEADSLASTVIQTMTDVLIEEKLEQTRKQTSAAWMNGDIQQIFLNRDLGDFRGEVYFHDVARPSLLFKLALADVHTLFGVPQETEP